VTLNFISLLEPLRSRGVQSRKKLSASLSKDKNPLDHSITLTSSRGLRPRIGGARIRG